MKHVKRLWWRLPGKVRKPIVTTVGFLFIIAAAFTGWLPGPGGIPLFLIGIAILASEFEWAERIRDWILDRLHDIGQWLRRHQDRALNILVLLICATALIAILSLGKS